jgi:iron complex outermembrane receptor protein
MKHILLRSCALAALALPAAAHAQSTGSVEFEENEIVVTGVLTGDVGGVAIPDTSKAKLVLEEEAIRRQRPGQTVNDIVNLVPGVSFQNNDPWGSSGGTFTIRGFPSDRISQTVDGIPLNDSGNYALYTNQQVDPEVLEQVNVNLGVTDVDSPTASAVGGTINMRTRVPGETFGIVASASYGDVLAKGKPDPRPYKRGFIMVDTGDITGAGTTMFLSASKTKYENPFNNYGEVDKLQFNGRVHQWLGDGGDFVSVAGHYNENRNNFFGSFALDAFPETREDRFYDINYPCTLPAGTLAGGGGGADSQSYSDSSSTGDCGSEFDRRYNPSNTGNVRGSSRFTLADGLVLTVDPSYQYVKANGGGAEDLREGFFTLNGTPHTGFLGGGYYFGQDLNGDGDLSDRIGGIDPSQTRTHRFGVISSLAYEINPEHRVRLAYTWDRANHRQTGKTGFLQADGEPEDVFPINDPVVTSEGYELTKRDRQSYAILHQISGEWRGEFGPLTANVGVRAPFFTRELNQFCYTTSAGSLTGDSFLDCIPEVARADYEAANPYSYDPATNTVTGSAPPQSRTYKYDKLLPNVGAIYDIGAASVFANYAKGLSVPGTDPLYDSLYFPEDAPGVQPLAETTDSFDLGVRYQSGNIQAQLAGWLTKYQNRVARAYDPVLDRTIYRNLGKVDKYGLDASVAWQPTPATLLYVFGSINESEIQNDLQNGTDGAGNPIYLMTGGKKESGTPTFTFGARGQVRLGQVEIGAQIKRTGKRYVNDENLPVLRSGVEVHGATVGGYTLVDLDARWNVMPLPTGGDLALQINVTNLFDKHYVGGFGGSLSQTNVPFVQLSPPRAASVSIIAGF